MRRSNNDIPNIMNGLKTYYLQKGKYPDTGTGLKALVDAQILDKIPTDPWQHPYVYMLEANKPVVSSRTAMTACPAALGFRDRHLEQRLTRNSSAGRSDHARPRDT